MKPYLPLCRERNTRGVWRSCRRERAKLQRGSGWLAIPTGSGRVYVVWVLFRLSHFSRADLLILIPVSVFVIIAVLHGRLLRAVAALPLHPVL